MKFSRTAFAGRLSEDTKSKPSERTGGLVQPSREVVQRTSQTCVAVFVTIPTFRTSLMRDTSRHSGRGSGEVRVKDTALGCGARSEQAKVAV